MASFENVPLTYLLTCSESGLKDFAMHCCNEIANLKKARRELNEELLMWEGRAQLIEKLIASREEIFDICRKDLRQAEFKFEPKHDVRRRVAAA